MHPECGGIDVFIGTVRNATKGKTVVQLEFEAYETMALSEMHKIAKDAMKQWKLHKVLVHHRIGVLKIGEVPVVIAGAAAHRDAGHGRGRLLMAQAARPAERAHRRYSTGRAAVVQRTRLTPTV